MYCDKCGAVVDGDSNYCDACGKILNENKNGKIKKFLIVDENDLKEEVQVEKTINIKKILMVAIVLLIVGGVVYLSAVKVYSKIVVKKEEKARVVKKTVTDIDTDWPAGEFILDGMKFELNTKYKDYEFNNWTIDNSSYNYNNMSFIKDDKTSVSIPLVNKKYDAIVKIGIINLEDNKKNIVDCEVWGISVNNISKEKPVEFKLSKGIKNNSTYEEIMEAYGTLDEENITINEDNVVLHYQKDYSIYLDLTVTKANGLESFSYKKY